MNAIKSEENKANDDILMFIAGLQRAIEEIDSVIANVFTADELTQEDMKVEAAETCKEWIEAIIVSIEDGTCDYKIEIH